MIRFKLNDIACIYFFLNNYVFSNNTVRGNIVFGMQYNEEKYFETVRICALGPDFKTFAAGIVY
jgi:ABC-type molybdate transport system ATPase subunit